MEEWLQCKRCFAVLQHGPALATHFLLKHEFNILQLEPPTLEFGTTSVNLAASSPYWEKILLPHVTVNIRSTDRKMLLVEEERNKNKGDVSFEKKDMDGDDEEARLLAEMEEELFMAEMEGVKTLDDDENEFEEDEDDDFDILEDEGEDDDFDIDNDEDEESCSLPSSNEGEKNEIEIEEGLFDRPHKRNDYALAAETEENSWPRTLPKDFICCKCLSVFDSREELEQHKKSHKGERMFACPECDDAFTCKTNLKYHQLKHSDEWDWLMKHPRELKLRRREIRLEMTRERRKLYRPQELKQCPHCPRKFAYVAILKRHLLRHAQKRPHLCETCGCSYYDEYHLRKHLERNACQSVLAKSASRIWQCDICLQRLKTEKGLKSHQRSQHGVRIKRPDKLLKCVLCGYEASNAHSLSKHQTSHTGEKNFECEAKCGSKFGLRINMLTHMRRHCALSEALGIAEKLRKEKANRQASSATARRNNVPPSLDSKFTCEECGDKFPEVNRLHVHQKSHGDAVKCEVCSAGFRHFMGLALHKKRVHPEHQDSGLIFKCEVCGVRFEVPYRLKVHMADVHQMKVAKNFKPNTQKGGSRKKNMSPSETVVKTETAESDEFQNIVNVLGGDDHEYSQAQNPSSETYQLNQFTDWSVNHQLVEDDENFEGGKLIVLENDDGSAVYDDHVGESTSPVVGEWKRFEFLDNFDLS